MVQPLGYNDGILLASLLYSVVDLKMEWDQFASCHKPIHQWLLVSYLCVITFRATHLLGMHTACAGEHGNVAGAGSGAGEFLLDLRQKGMMPRILATFTWLLALPFFVLWTLIGTSWLWDVTQKTPQCMPTDTHLWFSGFWLALCYVWIFIHCALGCVAWVLERRVRQAETDLREIEEGDSDVASRWGNVSQISGYRALQGDNQKGLTPTEIKALPLSTHEPADDVEGSTACECSVCLCDVCPGDSIRCLPACGHSFHRSCIDLWLLRSADCPLCKRSARVGKNSE